ncbi:MAG: hypothetical protein RIC55_10395 [Pirellulaceae bacterium]
MTNCNKAVLRAAVRIYERLTKPAPNSVSVGMFDAASNLCLDVARKIQKAEARGWHAATRRLRSELATALEQLTGHVADVRAALEPPVKPLVMPTPQIYRDLLALQREFEEVKIDVQKSRVTARTSSIELEGVYLGPFDIVLYWDRLGLSDAYEVIAVDPLPATCNDNVTHPHVDGDRLCEGDGRLPIRNAQRQGRLFDFFLIVRQTLETYNPSSAYVDLGEWSGQRCEDCDSTIEDSFTCRQCSATVCDDCMSECLCCDAIACSDCKTTCAACDDPFCSKCLTPCITCKDSICKECSLNGQCPDCERKNGAEDVQLVEESTASAAV